MTREATSKHWASIDEVSFVAGMRLLFWVYRLLGAWPFRIALYPVLFWYVLTQKKARSASKRYLQRVADYSGQTLPTNLFAVVRHFAAFAETILEKMLLWGGLFKADRVQYFGQEALHHEIDTKRGALLICSHIGNIDMCRVLSRRYPQIKLTVLVHTKHAAKFNRMMAKLNPESQLDLMQVSEMTPATAMLLSERIAQGGFVVLAGDRVPISASPRVTMVDFLGEKAAFPIGPYVLASLLQCPVYLLFSLTIKGVPQVHFELLSDSVNPKRAERERVFQALAAKYAERLAYFCQAAPLQWFNFFDFWNSSTRIPPVELDKKHDPS